MTSEVRWFLIIIAPFLIYGFFGSLKSCSDQRNLARQIQQQEAKKEVDQEVTESPAQTKKIEKKEVQEEQKVVQMPRSTRDLPTNVPLSQTYTFGKNPTIVPIPEYTCISLPDDNAVYKLSMGPFQQAVYPRIRTSAAIHIAAVGEEEVTTKVYYHPFWHEACPDTGNEFATIGHQWKQIGWGPKECLKIHPIDQIEWQPYNRAWDHMYFRSKAETPQRIVVSRYRQGNKRCTDRSIIPPLPLEERNSVTQREYKKQQAKDKNTLLITGTPQELRLAKNYCMKLFPLHDIVYAGDVHKLRTKPYYYERPPYDYLINTTDQEVQFTIQTYSGMSRLGRYELSRFGEKECLDPKNLTQQIPKEKTENEVKPQQEAIKLEKSYTFRGIGDLPTNVPLSQTYTFDRNPITIPIPQYTCIGYENDEIGYKKLSDGVAGGKYPNTRAHASIDIKTNREIKEFTTKIYYYPFWHKDCPDTGNEFAIFRNYWTKVSWEQAYCIKIRPIDQIEWKPHKRYNDFMFFRSKTETPQMVVVGKYAPYRSDRDCEGRDVIPPLPLPQRTAATQREYEKRKVEDQFTLLAFV